MTLTWSQALAWRLYQQLLDPIGDESVEAVVKRLVAVKAPTAEVSIRARQQHSNSGEVERAIAEGRLIKTFAFRGGTHLFTPEDAGVYLALRASSRMWELPSWQSYYKLKPTLWLDLRKAVRDALADGPMTSDELKSAVTAHRQFKHLGSLFSKTLEKPLTWLGDMSFGAPRGGQATFQRLDSNPRWTGIPELDVAGQKAIVDYLRAYGPARAQNLRFWLGEALGAGKFIKRWFAAISDNVVAVKIKGSEAFVLREDLEQLTATQTSKAVRLLPAYDQWVMGPGTSDANVVPARIRPLISRGANPVLFGGRVSGTWSVVEDKLTIVWIEKRKPVKKTLAEEIERLSAILNRPLKWTIKTQ